MKFAMMMSAGIALALGGTAVAQDQGPAMGGGRGGDTSSTSSGSMGAGSMGNSSMGGTHHASHMRSHRGRPAMHKSAMGKSSASATSGRSPGSDGMTPTSTH